MSYIDFHAVPVGNQTAGWFTPDPFPFAVWFPFQAQAPANGVLYSVKEEYSGVVYVPVADLDVSAPQWAIWTAFTPEALTLTVFTPSERRGRPDDLGEPVVVTFEPSTS